jgi:glycosyltransferase involved in cell wall biosynthesis
VPDVVFVHAHAPPTTGGTPVLLGRLLDGIAGDVVTARRLRPAVDAGGQGVLRGEYHYFVDKGLRGNRFAAGRLLTAVGNAVLAIPAAVVVARAARRRKRPIVVSVVDSGISQLAGHLGARLARAPHVIMIFDLWAENAYTAPERSLARLFERRVLRAADAVVVHCREMADFYRQKHGIECEVVPTAIDLWEPAARPPRTPPAEVVFAGAVYWAQEDAVRRLADAVRQLDGVRLTLIGAGADLQNLERRRLVPDAAVPALPAAELRRRLEAADVAVVGLSFASKHPSIVATASPAKLPEYMASGTPILVHAPRGSHVAEYAREGGFAEVVDSPDEEMLAAALLRLIDDEEHAAKLAAKARRLAEQRHALEHVRERFAAVLERVRA